MSFTDDQLDRYARHIVLKEVGGAGQRQLAQATVTLVGAGGIGSPALQYLAAAGIGTIRLIDDDIVALSNLQRQVIFGTSDIGRPKVEVASEAAARLNPDTRIIPLAQRLTPINAADLIGSADVVIDGSDSFATRLAVADTAHTTRIPLVSAAVDQFSGQLAVYRGWEAGKPCYRCLVGHDPARPDTSCAERGVLGPMTGVLGSLAALEAIRAITGFGNDPAGQLMILDALSFRARTVALPKDPACTCGGHA